MTAQCRVKLSGDQGFGQRGEGNAVLDGGGERAFDHHSFFRGGGFFTGVFFRHGVWDECGHAEQEQGLWDMFCFHNFTCVVRSSRERLNECKHAA